MTQPIKNPFPTPSRPLQKQRNRQILTVLSAVFLVSSFILVLQKLGIWALVALTLSAALGILLVFATRNLSNSINLITDERERSLRDHAHRVSYWIMAGVLGGVYGGMTGYLSTREGSIPVMLVKDFFSLETQVFLLIIAGIFLGLPTYFIAWLEPDPIEE